MRQIIAAGIVALIGAAISLAAEDPVAPGAQVQKLADGFKFTEGPAADIEGNVFFTDQPEDRILEWSVDGRLTTFMQPSGRSNGMYFDRQGKLITCADETNQLWEVDRKRRVKVLVKDFEGKLLNGPNDLWVAPDNSIYFTDPLYQRPYWKRGPMEQSGQHVYWLSADRKKLVRVIEDFKQPNGIIGTPDGKLLYVSDIGAGMTWAYDIRSGGALANKRLFCNTGSDGMTIDEKGNVYLTGKGVSIFDSLGNQIGHINVEQPWTANVTFGGSDRRTLFITAGTTLYSIRMQVRGR